MKRSSLSTELTIRELCILALTGALMFALQVAMASLPNIHLTALLVILAAVFFGWKSLYSIVVFIMLEGLIFGFGAWWFSYWYIWPSLAIPAVLMRQCRSALIWACIAAIHGLLFGALCAIPYLFIGGWEMAFSYWVAGLPFDFLHCAGNFVLTLLLFNPLYKTLSRVI